MNVIEAMKVVCENTALEARCGEYRKYRSGDVLCHSQVIAGGGVVPDTTGFDSTEEDWTIHVRATGELYVIPESAPAPAVKTMVRLPCRNNTFALVDPAEVAEIETSSLSNVACLVSIRNHTEDDRRIVTLPQLEAARRLGIKVVDAIEWGAK